MLELCQYPRGWRPTAVCVMPRSAVPCSVLPSRCVQAAPAEASVAWSRVIAPFSLASHPAIMGVTIQPRCRRTAFVANAMPQSAFI
ncbi:hypothetical protein IG631_20936 [Alternaria alternata]|nr:hypothetical protein IG631_20936 [Alternaria alternata]